MMTRQDDSPELPHRLTVRVDDARRAYPTIRVFIDAVMVYATQTTRTEAQSEAQALRDNADMIVASALPRNRCIEVLYQHSQKLGA